ncbi:MAG: hypothetical protein LC105_03485 [Chitinophagales bacterium]|nr:hypothetical protein [Chitinophagales bacterium]MCZ2392904.1 hypothetical protein [Chitinophagales bacterium]
MNQPETKISEIELYRSLGYLIYAIATYSNRISKERIKLLKNELISPLYTSISITQSDESQTISQTELILNWLISHGLSSKFAIDSFSNFIKKKEAEINPELKEFFYSFSKEVAEKLHSHEDTEEILQCVKKILHY